MRHVRTDTVLEKAVLSLEAMVKAHYEGDHAEAAANAGALASLALVVLDQALERGCSEVPFDEAMGQAAAASGKGKVGLS